MKKQKTKNRRLFLALWPEPDVREQISACQRSLEFQNNASRRAQLVREENLHLTLCFLGAVAEDRIEELSFRLAKVEQQEFELQLQSFGYFSAPGIAWLGLKTQSSALLQLVGALTAVVTDALPGQQGFNNDFIAHVSLCRNTAALPETANCETVYWQVTEFALVESINTMEGVVYKVLQRWPLISQATLVP